jgi:hypothetical protein
MPGTSPGMTSFGIALPIGCLSQFGVGRIGAHRVRAKRGPMTGSGVIRHLGEEDGGSRSVPTDDLAPILGAW